VSARVEHDVDRLRKQTAHGRAEGARVGIYSTFRSQYLPQVDGRCTVGYSQYLTRADVRSEAAKLHRSLRRGSLLCSRALRRA
jgi:hypothetical protein